MIRIYSDKSFQAALRERSGLLVFVGSLDSGLVGTLIAIGNEVGLSGSQPQLAGFGIAALHLELGDCGQGFSRAFGV